GRLEQTAGQEERRRHDVELPAELARDRQRLRYVRRLHETETQYHPREGLAHRLDAHAVRGIDARRVRRLDGEDDVLLVQHLVMLEAVHQCGRRAQWITGEEYRGAGHADRRLLFETGDQEFERRFL